MPDQWAEHKRRYPEQYSHPAVGRRYKNGDLTVTVVRVIQSRFGELACVDDLNNNFAISLRSLKPVE